MKRDTELWLFVPDAHYPKIDRPTLAALLDFLKINPVNGFIFGGDSLDRESISHHTDGKGLYRVPGAYMKETRGFDEEVLTPVEKLLSNKCEKVWIVGNHEFWEFELIEKRPELQSTIEHEILLNLGPRGWKVIPFGKSFKHGELTFIHGEQLSGVGNQTGVMHSRKALDLYCTNVLYGHLHAPQSFTKVLPHDRKSKWQSWCSPILGHTNPGYLENRPSAWLNGWTIIEFRPNGTFNVFPLVCIDGFVSYGGKTYGRGK